MGNEYRTKVFKSGNSLALRLPKGLGIAEGVEMIVREERGRYAFEPADADSARIDLSGVYGSRPGLKPLEPEDRAMEPRELDWSGARLHGD